MPGETIVLTVIAFFVYSVVILGPVIIGRKLEKIRNCSKKDLPNALLFYLRVMRMAPLAQISNHFNRPMEELKKNLSGMKQIKKAKESSGENDPGWELWTIA